MTTLHLEEMPWSLGDATVTLTAGDVAGTAWAVTGAFDPVTNRLELELGNAGELLLRPQSLRLAFTVDITTASGWMAVHGRYMQQDALVHVFGEPAPEGYENRYLHEEDEGASTLTSNELAVLSAPVKSTPALLLGSLRGDRCFMDIVVSTTEDEASIERVELAFDLRGVEVAPGQRLALPPVLCIEGRETQSLLERYADDVALEMGARLPDHVPTGWCSWYFFSNRVSEADVLSNLAEMRATGHPAEYVQVDDGYQSCTGDWLVPNEKFPSGMEALAGHITEAGYRPGLWLAPFVMHENSAVLRDFPEMALKTPSGATYFVETWLGRCAVLDCTHPASEAWLRGVFMTVTRAWGYSYLKLDALAYAAATPGEVVYSAPGTTAPANLRRGLEIIREAAGEETFILGCTCHFAPAVGLVDGMRVGPDVKETWDEGPHPSVKHAMRLTLARNFMHNRWWVNDPDCLIVRDGHTDLYEREVRFLATGIALSGGMVVASDHLPDLPPARRNLALALFPPSGVAARPYEPGEGPVPSAWRADLGEGRSLVGILNWSDAPRWVISAEYLRPGEVAFGCWDGRLLGMGDVFLGQHEGTLWQVTGPAAGKTPRLVGDSGSITYHGLYQRQVSGRIQVRNDLARARTIAIEARGRTFEVELAPGEMRWFD
jgi:alpha-galactosidase